MSGSSFDPAAEIREPPNLAFTEVGYVFADASLERNGGIAAGERDFHCSIPAVRCSTGAEKCREKSHERIVTQSSRSGGRDEVNSAAPNVISLTAPGIDCHRRRVGKDAGLRGGGPP
jgi:hypothetical protein